MLINRQYRDAAQTAELLFKEIVLNDDYKLRELAFRGAQPAVIYDIGANIGLAALQARMLFPRAEIICVEPCPETFAVLSQNTEHLRVWTKQAALAAGGPVRMVCDPLSDGGNRVEPGGHIEAITLGQLVLGGLSPYVIKLDCEGGEGSILVDDASRYALKHALHWAMEYHPPLTGISAEMYRTELELIDPRTTGRSTIDGRWLFWSKAKDGRE